jgi:GT2 family glycosyltransferase
MNTVTSSVILCTRNRLTDVISFLKSLSLQIEFANQLIVIDSSTQPINEIETFNEIFNEINFPKTQLIYIHTSPGLPYQRNVGISHVTKDIIYFFDDDTILESNYLQVMNAIFAAHPEYAGGMGTVTNTPPKQDNVFRLARNIVHSIFLLQSNYSSGNFKISGIPTHAYGTEKFKNVEVLGGCCMAFRASALAKHKFDESLGGYAFMEDCDISRRVSYDAPLFYNPRARLQHLESPLARDRVLDNRAMYMKNYSYLFFKNFYPRNKLKIIAYGWSVIGLFVEAVLMLKKDYIKGYYKGLKQYYLKESK